MNYNWNWGIFFQTSPDGVHTYLGTLISAPAGRWRPRSAAWCLALAMGSLSASSAPRPILAGPARQRLCGAVPQHPAAGADVPVVLRAARCCRPNRRLAQAASRRLVLHRRGRARLLHLGARRRAGARRHHEPRPRPAHGRARARAHAAAGLRLRAAADGLSHHPAAADVGIPQHHQEQRGRAHHRADGAHGARARHAGIHLPGVRGLHRGDRHLHRDQYRRDLRHALGRAPRRRARLDRRRPARPSRTEAIDVRELRLRRHPLAAVPVLRRHDLHADADRARDRGGIVSARCWR